jgi:hypothetical protein
MIYTSSEMKSVINIEQSNVETLQFYLVRNFELFNISEFSLVCNSMISENGL